jgi:hypothetical protein
VLVAGDEAALVDHWSREGVSCALRSGNLAGHAAARSSALPTRRRHMPPPITTASRSTTPSASKGAPAAR